MKSSLFSHKTQIYENYRPNYPRNLIHFLTEKFIRNDKYVIAEIGCGTGKLTRLLLEKENVLYGVEPNNEMYKFLKDKFGGLPNFIVLNSTAEKSLLPSPSLQIMTTYYT